MGVLRLTVVFLALHLTAAASSTCPASAPAKPSGRQHALLQQQRSLYRALKVDANSSDKSVGGEECPWAATTNVDWQLQCVDRTLCDSWSCCDDHGGRWKCPPNRPLMCEALECNKGQSHCCRTHCRGRYGGLRTCPLSGVCPYRGTTETDDTFECADKTTCTKAGCCTSKGGVAKCPMNSPLMCAAKSCDGDHCCKTDCKDFGGIRSCPSSPSQVLMLGNSFTHYNNGVDAVLRNFFSDAGKATRILALTKGGADWGYHVNQAETEGTLHFTELGPGSPVGFVVLQEQSYIPGTCCHSQSDPDFEESKDNLFKLDRKNAAIGARTVLYQTWGWREGHRSRPYLSDFPKFNAEVKKGYLKYEQFLAGLGRPPLLAPVGDAFKIIFDQGSGTGSLFYRLFDDDARHPGLLGTYLAGCVVYSTITGEKCSGLPAPGISTADASILQAAADKAAFPNPE